MASVQRMVMETILLAISLSCVSADFVCYGSGAKRRCFSNGPPFDGWPMPQDPYGAIAPTYHLFQQTVNNSRVINSSLEMNLSNGLVVVIHGWMGDIVNTEIWNRPMIANLLTIMPTIDVLFVDWAEGAAFNFKHPYRFPASNTRSIAAALVDFLLENRKFDPTVSHCIGFSLGSHVCGFAGKRLIASRVSSFGWGRLTALDPAFPYFDVDDPTARVDKMDAKFVDVVHTSRLGLSRAIGHVDFYVSGGSRQPGCSLLSGRRRRRNLFDKITLSIENSIICSHERAPEIFAETILHEPVFIHEGLVTDFNETGSGMCTFSNFCPCDSISGYNKGRCQICDLQDGQIIGYWSFKRSKNVGNFYGKLKQSAPFCDKAK